MKLDQIVLRVNIVMKTLKDAEQGHRAYLEKALYPIPIHVLVEQEIAQRQIKNIALGIKIHAIMTTVLTWRAKRQHQDRVSVEKMANLLKLALQVFFAQIKMANVIHRHFVTGQLKNHTNTIVYAAEK